MPQMTGARLFADMMRGYEVSHIFFVPAFMLKAFAEMEDMPIHRVMVHGEKAAAYMADGYARASGKPGVCMAQMIGASRPRARTRGQHSGSVSRFREDRQSAMGESHRGFGCARRVMAAPDIRTARVRRRKGKT